MLLCLVKWYLYFCRSLLVNAVSVGVAHRKYRPNTLEKAYPAFLATNYLRNSSLSNI